MLTTQYPLKCYNNDFFINDGIKLHINIKIVNLFYKITLKVAPKRPL